MTFQGKNKNWVLQFDDNVEMFYWILKENLKKIMGYLIYSQLWIKNVNFVSVQISQD